MWAVNRTTNPTISENPLYHLSHSRHSHHCGGLISDPGLVQRAKSVTDYTIKTCSVPELCANVSLNLGAINMTFNAKCCSTDLCNAEKLPVLPKQAPNGRTCYTCDAHGCSAKLRCEGDKDRCVAVSVHQENETMFFKGCMSKSLCTASGPSIVPGISVSKVKCCEGNLCNGAESFTLSFLLMIIPLLSSILFY
ncbi:urokinase plasminogen activator surface receptor-like [Ictalurus furcatus]|uniref:urokinase plasminogen activator surface receptor-like n=1 Tax=Ictalurus furcatus TaxID=66913 RepID=UPI002350F16D|nr:urokinase plasminogen activator surface receptor-like [Ictalurus furcatus]